MADPNHGANSDGSQESQEMTLVIRTGDRTIQVPLRGNMILLENSSDQAPPPAVDPLKEIRGSLVTVAALFVGMAFQAVTQPPAWMPDDKLWSSVVWGTEWSKRWHALSPDERRIANRAITYHTFNTVIFSSALALMLLLVVKSATITMNFVRASVLCFISIVVAFNFVNSITVDQHGQAFLYVILVGYILVLVFVWSILGSLCFRNPFVGFTLSQPSQETR